MGGLRTNRFIRRTLFHFIVTYKELMTIIEVTMMNKIVYLSRSINQRAEQRLMLQTAIKVGIANETDTQVTILHAILSAAYRLLSNDIRYSKKTPQPTANKANQFKISQATIIYTSFKISLEM